MTGYTGVINVMSRHVLSPDQEKRVVAAWQTGESMRQIAFRIGVADRTIRNILNRQNAERDHFCPCGASLEGRDIRLRYCDECREIVSRQQKIDYYLNNLDLCKARSAQWYRENLSRFQETNSQWHAANRPKSNAAIRRWKRRNPDRVREAGLRRRALLHKAFVEDVNPATLYEMHGGMCGICKEFINGDFHVDHVIPLGKKGLHCYANCQPAHSVCNLKKHDKIL